MGYTNIPGGGSYQYLQGVFAGGPGYDNWPTINNALQALAGTGGALPPLPPGGATGIGISQPLVPPAGVWITGQPGSTCAYGQGLGLYGSTLIPTTNWSGGAELVNLSNPNTGIRDLALNAYGFNTRAIMLAADHVKLQGVFAIGAFSVNTIDSNSGATNVGLRDVEPRAYNASSQALASNGSDWLCSDVRPFGAVTFNAAGSQWSKSCHISQISGINLLATISADTDYCGYFDSLNGSSGAIALVQLTGGVANLDSARFVNNFTVNGFPMILNSAGTLHMVGAYIAAPAQGVSGQFSCVLSGARPSDVVKGLFMGTNSVPISGQQATMFLSASGGPAECEGCYYGGILQKSYPIIKNATSKPSTSALAIGLSGSYGAATVINMDTNVQGMGTTPGLTVTWAGTFSGDTCQFQCTPTYSDGTTGSATQLGTVSSTQTQTIGTSQWLSMAKDGQYIVSLSCQAKTTNASTTVTCQPFLAAQNII